LPPSFTIPLYPAPYPPTPPTTDNTGAIQLVPKSSSNFSPSLYPPYPKPHDPASAPSAGSNPIVFAACPKAPIPNGRVAAVNITGIN
jgi:hypothetical protein